MGRPLDPTSTRWKRLKAAVIKRDTCCFVCGTTDHLTVHHIRPRKHGGKTEPRNLITMCAVCHNRVECYDMDWPAIINLQKQKRYRLDDDFEDLGRSYKIGRDRFGVFIIRDASQKDPIVYDGVWPKKSPTVKERPQYILLPY